MLLKCLNLENRAISSSILLLNDHLVRSDIALNILDIMEISMKCKLQNPSHLPKYHPVDRA